MKYNVSWIINGELNINQSSKEKAEADIENILKKIINKNIDDFNKLGAIAIQGNATLVDEKKSN